MRFLTAKGAKDAKEFRKREEGIVDMDIEETAGIIVDAALTVHRALGPGLLESVYQTCLAHELKSRGLKVECEVLQPIL
ncbi:MAG TPA: GxxExxY protein [Anaerolineaceae bacterium]|nr:GxxExxY protein [Anaerolineaceae bacterium]HPN54054.1 GxxExxY protein [Anaerolineaceae bacterium]